MRKTVVVCLIVAVLFGLGCGGAKTASNPKATSGAKDYADLVKLVDDMKSVMKTFETEFADADKTRDGKGVAMATDKLFGKLGALINEQKKILEKYPEIKNGTGPAHLQELQQGMADFNGRLIQAIGQVGAYKDDPSVMDVLKQLNNIIKANS